MSTKLHRWIDLLAALLGHRLPVTFADLARDVPAYLDDGSVAAGNPSPTLKRMFERDKAELLALGVPIVALGEEGSAESAYQLRSKNFYLPYLAIVAERGIRHPTKVDRFGYRSLETLAFEPDELQAIVEGARRVARLGDSVLAAEARSAVRKLAFDLPLGATDTTADALLVPPRRRADPGALAALGDALFRRKRVTFDYQTIGTGTSAERTVEPYGLFFVSGHWYLAARDVEKDALRNFRVSRVAGLQVNASRPRIVRLRDPEELLAARPRAVATGVGARRWRRVRGDRGVPRLERRGRRCRGTRPSGRVVGVAAPVRGPSRGQLRALAVLLRGRCACRSSLRARGRVRVAARAYA